MRSDAAVQWDDRRLLIRSVLAAAPTAGGGEYTHPSRRRAKAARLTHEQFTDWSDMNTMGRGAWPSGTWRYAEYLYKRKHRDRPGEVDTDPRLMAQELRRPRLGPSRPGHDEDAEPLAEWALTVREHLRPRLDAGRADRVHPGHDRGRPAASSTRRRSTSSSRCAACERGMGPNHPFTADALDDLATLLVLRRSLRPGTAALRAGVKIFRGVNPDHVGQYVPLDGLATIDLNQGKYTEAEERLDEATRASTATDSPTRPTTPPSWSGRRQVSARWAGRRRRRRSMRRQRRSPRRTPPATPPNARTDASPNGWPGP